MTGELLRLWPRPPRWGVGDAEHAEPGFEGFAFAGRRRAGDEPLVLDELAE